MPRGLSQLAFQLGVGVYGRTLRGSDRVDDPAALQSVLATISLRHHFGAGLALDMQLPAGLVRFDPGPGVPAGYISGLGDIRVGARYDFAALWGLRGKHPSLALRGAIALPTGEQRTITAQGGTSFPPSVLAVGRGAFGVEARLALTQPLGAALALVASVGVDVPLSRNASGVRFGAAFDGGLGLMRQMWRRLTLQARLRYRYRGRADEQGEGTLLQSGGHALSGEATAAVRLGKRFTVGASVSWPIYFRVNGRQIAESVTTSTFLAVSFGGGGDKPRGHEHAAEHAHGAHHDRAHERHGARRHHAGDAPGDFADAARGGATISLARAAVAGKVTVIDFWATWCKPCHVIGRRLRALAARHRKTLAVRRVEVPTLQSAAGRAHAVKKLPLLLIVGPRGRLLRRLEAPTPDAALAAVRSALGAGHH